MTDKKAKAYALADNRTGDASDWDEVILAKLLLELDGETIPGFDETEIADIIQQASETAEGGPGAPEDFPDASEDTNRQCPKCDYAWKE